MTPASAPPKPDWTRSPARPVAAIILSALMLGALPTAFSRESPSSPGAASAPNLLLDLNAATFEELVMLPGIGPARARAIIEHRQTKGPFQTIDSLDAVKGFGPATIDDLRPFLTVSPPSPTAP